MGFGQGPLAVIDADVAIDVQEPHGGTALRDAMAGQGAAELGGTPHGGQPAQLAAQRLDLGGAVQAEQAAERIGRVLFAALGALDAQPGHEQQHRHGGA